MRRLRKARQKKRRKAQKKKKDKQVTASADKAFAATLQRDVRKGYPHMEWNGSEFTPQKPESSPTLQVNVSLMHSCHKKFGVRWRGSRKGSYQSRRAKSVADTGCQTCTAGVDFLEDVGCPESYLIPTSHSIVGITAAPLGIIGAVLLRIEINGKVTRQMVHISSNLHGRSLYLSRSACRELGLITDEFPAPAISSSAAAAQSVGPCEGGCLDDDPSAFCPLRAPTPDPPAKIPFPPTRENVIHLKNYLLDVFKDSAFLACTYQPLQGMEGEPMRIVLKPGASLHNARVFRPIPVPFHFKRPVKKGLDRDVRMEVLQKIPQGEVPDHISQMVIATKSNGKPRRTVDYQELNKATSREVHHTPSPINLVASIPGGKLKTVVDAWNGFHSLVIDEESRNYTAFVTEWGVYRYCRAPQGFHGSGDAYTRRFDDITSQEERYVRCVDDGLLYDDDIEGAFWHTFHHLKHCADRGVVFNRDKFQFAGEVVDFAGFEVSMEGYKPAKRTIEAIRDFPVPKNVTDVRAWFGIVNQVAYAFSQGELMQPFRCLLEKKQPFYWDDTLDKMFRISKSEIIKRISQGVRAYDLEKPTCLATDWCKDGIGFSLTQKHCKCSGSPDPNCGNGHWKIVFAGSKTLHGAQRRYAPIEGECLAAAYGLHRCRMYTLGCPNLTLAVDHKPLTNILNDRQLDTIDNPRLRRLKEKTFPFNFGIVHVAGGSDAMKIADALSRHSVDDGSSDTVMQDVEESTKAFAVMQADGVESVTWRRVNEAASVDQECVALVRLIVDGFPTDKSSLPSDLQVYWNYRDELYVVENVPFKGHKMLIPRNLRTQVLEGLHAANQGVTGMLANARNHFFWPGLDAAIRQMRLQCRQCNEQAPSQPAEPAISTPPPEFPFEQTVADLFKLEGHTFLAYADRFSGWLEVERLPTSSFRFVRQSLLRWFVTYGVPAELENFLKQWDVRRRLSSAYYPQSNGRAEAAVKSAKRILLGNINRVTGALDTDAAARALMTHRNTPAQDTGVSPAVMLFGRELRDHIPRTDRQLRPEWQAVAESREQALAKRALKEIESGKQELKPLEVGDSVQLQNQTGNQPRKWYNTGTVAGVLPHRQYQVILDGSRRVSLRNRKFLRKILPISRVNSVPEPLSKPSPRVSPPLQTDYTTNAGDDNPDTLHDLRALHPEQVHPAGVDILPTDDDVREDEQVGDESIVTSPAKLRRGGRIRKQRSLFSAKMTGKFHGESTAIPQG